MDPTIFIVLAVIAIGVVAYLAWRFEKKRREELRRWAREGGWRLDERSRVHLLSGEVERVLEVLAAWEVPYERDLATGEIIHPALVHVLGPDGSRGYAFNAPPVAWVVEATRRLAGSAIPDL